MKCKVQKCNGLVLGSRGQEYGSDLRDRPSDLPSDLPSDRPSDRQVEQVIQCTGVRKPRAGVWLWSSDSVHLCSSPHHHLIIWSSNVIVIGSSDSVSLHLCRLLHLPSSSNVKSDQLISKASDHPQLLSLTPSTSSALSVIIICDFDRIIWSSDSVHLCSSPHHHLIIWSSNAIVIGSSDSVPFHLCRLHHLPSSSNVQSNQLIIKASDHPTAIITRLDSVLLLWSSVLTDPQHPFLVNEV